MAQALLLHSRVVAFVHQRHGAESADDNSVAADDDDDDGDNYDNSQRRRRLHVQSAYRVDDLVDDAEQAEKAR